MPLGLHIPGRYPHGKLGKVVPVPHRYSSNFSNYRYGSRQHLQDKVTPVLLPIPTLSLRSLPTPVPHPFVFLSIFPGTSQNSQSDCLEGSVSPALGCYYGLPFLGPCFYNTCSFPLV